MKKLVKIIPIPFAGIMLALAALGNLVAKYSSTLKHSIGVASAICLILLTLKVIFDFETVKKSFNHPVLASVMCTYSMGIIVLSTYLIPFSKKIAYSFWVLGIILHFLLLIIFTKNHLFNFKLKKVFPSYFIVYVGFVCASVTAPAYSMNSIGKILFYIGFANYLLLLPIIIYRIVAIKEMPSPALPTSAIFAAPASLCLAGYLSSFTDKNPFFVSSMFLLSMTSVIIVLIFSPKLLKNGFFPSYSAFTFPLVISSIATAKTHAYFSKISNNTLLISNYSLSIFIIASLATLIVLIKYIHFINSERKLII